jgi:hypothetical protein
MWLKTNFWGVIYDICIKFSPLLTTINLCQATYDKNKVGSPPPNNCFCTQESKIKHLTTCLMSQDTCHLDQCNWEPYISFKYNYTMSLAN